MNRREKIEESVEANFHYLTKHQQREIVLFVEGKCYCDNCECNHPNPPWSST